MEKPTEAIVLKAYDLLKYAVPVLNALPRDYKFTLGDRIHNHLLDLLESLLEAVYLPAAEKKPVLRQVNLRLEKLRFMFRLGHDLNLFQASVYQQLITQADEIGRMTGGWLRTLG
ncbi:MAG: diversity-generating retroelement protein Avd [Saprospiraceae bacterium]